MKAKIKHVAVMGNLPPEAYTPDSTTHFGARLYLYIGPEDSRIEELFQIHVCSTSWFAENELTGQYQLGYAYMFAREWDWKRLIAELSDIVAACEADNWLQYGWRLSRYFNWEMAPEIVVSLGPPT
jgi:hypothetical protein